MPDSPSPSREPQEQAVQGNCRVFDPTNELQWLYRASRFTFQQMDHPNMFRRVEDYPLQIEACEQRDGSVLWAVRQLGNCLRTDGDWELECQPSSRTQEWINGHRFSSKERAYAAMMAALQSPVTPQEPKEGAEGGQNG